MSNHFGDLHTRSAPARYRRRALSLGRVVGFVGVLGVLVWMSSGRRNSASKEVLAEMQDGIKQLPAYPANAEYLDKLLEREHAKAFDEAYDAGSRRRSAKFDADKYRTMVLEGMAKECAKSGRGEAAEQLRFLNTVAAANPD